MRPRAGLFLLATVVFGQSVEPELFSPLGKVYVARQDLSGAVERADAALAKAPDSADLLLAAARARDALLRFRESIPMYTRGMDEFPNDVRFPRFRGHRFLSTRRYDMAVADLKKATEMAPSSFEASYHLALAYYLRGDFGHAAREYMRCLAMSPHPKPEVQKGMPAGWLSCYAMEDDPRTAITEWAWRALRRSGKPDEAAKLLGTIDENMTITENLSYFRTLLVYKGVRTEAEAIGAPQDGNAMPTMSYGLGLWHWLEGRKETACNYWRKALESPNWSAFGLIAAEVEISRGACGKPKK